MIKSILCLFAIAAVTTGAFALDQGEDIAELLIEADEKQFVEFFPKGVIYENVVRRVERVLPMLLNEINRKVPADANLELKEELAKRKANAAVVLLKMNQWDKVLPLFKHSADPTARSQLIDRLKPFNVDPRQIVEHLNHEPDITIYRALILSLGEFDDDALLPKDRNSLLKKLQDTYRNDADSGLHSAVEWLLRQWNQEEWLKQVNEAWANEREILPRRWFVNCQAETMVVIRGPVEFMMGSPSTELHRKPDETQHKGRIDRSFAIAAKEITVDEFLRFRKNHFYVEYHAPDGACPVNNVTWYEAAGYCNWLNEKEGITNDQWCYLPNEDGEYKPGMKIASNHLERTGYRLPTEMEWEYACRAGAETRHSFGDSENLFSKYAWTGRGESPKRSRPVGTLKPNELGLFDMHGNVREWCHDSYGPYAEGTDFGGIVSSEQDTTIDNKNNLVLRSGSFFWHIEPCSFRDYFPPRYCCADIGFRLARTIPHSPPTPKESGK